MSREVLQQALEALYENTKYSMRGDPMEYQDERNDDTIEAIKAALKQPDQVPVAWLSQGGDVSRSKLYFEEMGFKNLKPLVLQIEDGLGDVETVTVYTSPPKREWVGLTDEEATKLWDSTDNKDSWELLKRVEAKLKVLNT